MLTQIHFYIICFERFPVCLYIYIPVNYICVQIGLDITVLDVFNDYGATYSGMSEMYLDVSSWEVFSLLPLAHYTEYLICFSDRHAMGFGNTVKKDVRSRKERWREIAGERLPLINRRSCQLFGSWISLSWNTFLSLHLLLLFSQSLTLPFGLKQLYPFRSTEYRDCF